MSHTALAQQVESAQFSSHERKDGLLFIAQIHHRPFPTLLVQHQVNDGQLQRVQVLDLVHLYPVIFLIGCPLIIICFKKRIAPHRLVSHDEQILEVNELIVALILFIASGNGHALQKPVDANL